VSTLKANPSRRGFLRNIGLTAAAAAVLPAGFAQIASEGVGSGSRKPGQSPNTSLFGAGFPPFSWDRVPVSAHLGAGSGLTSDQYDFLAKHFDFITYTGSSEENTAAAARAVKQRNPQAKILFYWSADDPKTFRKESNASFPKGGYLVSPTKHKRWFDVARQDVRNWWSDVAAKAVRDYACDGIFADGAIAGSPGGRWSQAFGAQRAAVMEKAMFAMFREAHKKMGPDKLIIFNHLHGSRGGKPPVGEPLLQVTDGAMMDDFDRGANLKPVSKEYLASELEVMGKAAREGKIIIFKGWPGFTWWSDKALMKKPAEEVYAVAAERITFPLACFLVAAEAHSYFCYTWGWRADYGTFYWYPQFDKPLGPPKGAAKRSGWTYTREFKHASVFANLEKKTATIDWK